MSTYVSHLKGGAKPKNSKDARQPVAEVARAGKPWIAGHPPLTVRLAHGAVHLGMSSSEKPMQGGSAVERRQEAWAMQGANRSAEGEALFMGISGEGASPVHENAGVGGEEARSLLALELLEESCARSTWKTLCSTELVSNEAKASPGLEGARRVRS